MDGVINTDYTYFEFDKWIKYNDAIKKLTKEITKESFSYEKKIIKQELEDISYDQRIFEYVVKKYLDSDFFMNKYQRALRKVPECEGNQPYEGFRPAQRDHGRASPYQR